MGTGKVSEAAAIGVPDELKGSAIVCVCVPMPGVAATRRWRSELSQAVEQGMGASYRPRQVLLVDDLPKTRNMKVMRRVVRAVWQGSDPGDLSSLVNPEAVARWHPRDAAARRRGHTPARALRHAGPVPRPVSPSLCGTRC
jgi:acetyl-CoA synthetase